MSIVFHCQVPRTDWTFIHTYIYILICPGLFQARSFVQFNFGLLWAICLFNSTLVFCGRFLKRRLSKGLFKKIILYLDRYRSHSLFFLPNLKHMSSLLHLLFPVYILSLKLTAKKNWKVMKLEAFLLVFFCFLAGDSWQFQGLCTGAFWFSVAPSKTSKSSFGDFRKCLVLKPKVCC